MSRRGRFKELPPPHARSQQKLQKVAEAAKSGGSCKKWRKLQILAEARTSREKKIRSKRISRKEHKANRKKTTKERHKRKTSTKLMYTYKMIVVTRHYSTSDQNQAPARNFLDGGNGGRSSLCAHHPRRVVGT